MLINNVVPKSWNVAFCCTQWAMQKLSWVMTGLDVLQPCANFKPTTATKIPIGHQTGAEKNKEDKKIRMKTSSAQKLLKEDYCAHRFKHKSQEIKERGTQRETE